MKQKLLLTLATVPLAIAGGQYAFAEKRPNILYIMSDDHASQAIGAYHSRLHVLNPTPTIDRIAKEGVVFDNAFCTNSISTPSRACIMTGQYSQTNGVLDLSNPLDIDKQYLPLEMRKLGYQTAVIGKWHLHNAPENFDYYNVFYGQGTYRNPVMYEKGTKDSVVYRHRNYRGLMPGKRHQGYCSDIATDISLDWLKNKRDKKRPFMLMHQFKAPHGPFDNHERYDNYLKHITVPEPDSMWDDKQHGGTASKGPKGSMRDSIGSSVGLRHFSNLIKYLKVDTEGLTPDEVKHKTYQVYLKRYLRTIRGVDDNIKRLLDYLEETGELDNTIIIYTSDQGMLLGEHDYQDKRWMYEESMRMPFIVRYPKLIKPGRREKRIINNVDFAPTLISLAGGKVPTYMQGDDFTPLLKNEPAKDWKKVTYYRYWMHMIHHYIPGHFGVRTDRYKLIFFYAKDYDVNRSDYFYMSKWKTPVAWEFYDLKKDRKELHNQIDNPEYASVIKELKKELLRLRDKYDENDGERYPHIQKVIDAHWDDMKR